MKKTDEENQERNHPGYKVIPDKDRSGRFSYNPKSFASGANATVHLGYDGQTGRVCAVKIALPPDQNTILSQESNLKEAQVLAELNEPSVIDIYAHIRDEDKEYTVMAYMDPEVQPNLATLISEHKIDRSRLLPMLRSIAHTIEILAHRGVSHMDLKPANFFWDTRAKDDPTRPEIIFGDVGIANKVLIHSISDKRNYDAPIGSPNYLSPERIEHPEKFVTVVTQENKENFLRSDTFVVACIAYELLTGNKFFTYTGNVNTLYGIVFDSYANVEELKTHMSRDGLAYMLTVSLAPIFSKAFSQDPEQRYASPTEFVNALASALSPEPSRTRA